MDAITDVVGVLPNYAEPLGTTVFITVSSAALALVIAFGLGLATHSPKLILRAPARTFVEFIRGSSVVVQLFWFAYAMPALFNFRFDYLIVAGIIALAINYGAYSSEVVRGALQAVPHSQHEACTALGIHGVKKFWRVILPQAWPEMIPSLCSFAVMLLKASALVSMIAVVDLTEMAKTIGERPDQDRLVQLSFVLVVYFLLAWLIWSGMRALENRAKRGLGIDPKQRMATGAGGK
ncbi:amino acid ABC transporter permease [Haloglycomyces albus]|uniref:amino acid ABC transporter permease n=1 Tax=Haloglycomyces albus TaxID=526067 RepID=UPI0004B66632|nr:amino acid ABC transporter permease [Haloglycomyces albus]